MKLTSRFEEGFLYAHKLHNGQRRKATNVPYISHLLGVAALVIQYGGDEDQAIAALLHDAVEDQGGRHTLEDIRRKFGDRVARIVDGCTDSYDTPKRPWMERKQAYIERLKTEPPEVRLVSLCDKVDNARAIAADLRREGRSAWTKFKGGEEGSLWYYRTLGQVFAGFESGGLTLEFLRLIDTLVELTGEPSK